MDSVLAYRGLAIGVQAPPEIEAWLMSFFGPCFDRGAGPAQVSVTLVIDAARAEAMVAGATATGREIDWMTRDQGQVLLPLLRTVVSPSAAVPQTADARDVVREGEVLILPRADGADLVAPEDNRRTRMTLMRVVRELASGAALAAGDVPLHASAVVAGGGATVFVGPKMAGKTTLLCHSLGHAGARYLANDRVFIDPVSGVARGMPTIVKLRAGTLPIGEARFDPPELCAHLGVEAVGSAPVHRIVYVDPVRIVDDLALTPLAPTEAARLVLAHGLVAKGGQAAMFAREAPPPDIAALTERVPCFHLALGPRAYEPDNRSSTRSLIGL